MSIKITDLSPAMQASLLAKLGTSPKKPRSKKKTSQGDSLGREKTGSVGEQTLALHLRTHGVAFETEFRFNPDRRWKSDFRILKTKMLVEVEGGTWTGGRHTRGKGYAQDCEKYNWATSHGFLVLRYTTAQVNSGMALEGILTALKNIGDVRDGS